MRTAGDFVFLARACGIPVQEARDLDRLLLREVLAVIGPDIDNDGERRVFLPGREGGMGLQSVEMNAPAAHTASWHTCEQSHQQAWERQRCDACEQQSMGSALH